MSFTFFEINIDFCGKLNKNMLYLSTDFVKVFTPLWNKNFLLVMLSVFLYMQQHSCPTNFY